MNPRDCWGTPQALFDALNQAYHFDLDAAANADNHKCAEYCTETAVDGLLAPWTERRVFVNPPFSRIEPWVEKAARSDAALVVMILPASVNSRWFHKWVEPYAQWLFLPAGRLQFEAPPGIKASSNRGECIIVGYGAYRKFDWPGVALANRVRPVIDLSG